MKLTERMKKTKIRETSGFSKVAVNEKSKKWALIGLMVATAFSVVAVMEIGNKAEKTVGVVMLKDGAYKNEVITPDMLIEYPMILAEYEKYSIVNQKQGIPERRFVLWNERNSIVGAYAAYPIPSETAVEYRSLIKSRVDNSDTVLYSFPGKDIIQLGVGAGDLNAFKTFLQPGDKLNIDAVYSSTVETEKTDYKGDLVKTSVDVFRTEPVFGNIMIADLLNSNGDSILDIYSKYNDSTVFQQAQMDSSSSFQESVTPSILLVALTPEEKANYNRYTAKSGIQFKVSLPQREQ